MLREFDRESVYVYVYVYVYVCMCICMYVYAHLARMLRELDRESVYGALDHTVLRHKLYHLGQPE